MATFEQRVRVDGGLDPPRTAIEEADAKCVFHVGDRFGHGGLRHRKLLGRLCHAAPLHDGEKDMEIAQPEAPADATFPLLDLLCHRDSLYRYSEFRSSLYTS